MKQCTRRVCGIILYGLLGLAESVDQPVYTDTLGSGWQDWSWAAVNLANMAPVYFCSRSLSVTAAAWEAVYLHHDTFDTGAYADLTFWIHGGATGVQRLQAQAILNSVAQPAVSLASLPSNTWQRITLSLASLNVANKPNMEGCKSNSKKAWSLAR